MCLAKVIRTTLCRWSQNNPEGVWAVEGPEEELRKGSVILPNSEGKPITVVLGTPIAYRGIWYANFIRYPKHQDGGSWWTENWRVDKNLPSLTDEQAANKPAVRGRKGGR